MANHGGVTSLPRAHRPRAPPIMSNIPPITAPLAPLRPAPPPVTLTVPRPENERATNEYVETPFKVSPLPLPLPLPPPPPPPPHPPRRPTTLLPTAVSKQPTASAAAAAAAASFSKEPSSQLPECAIRPSIMCPECGRCRCESCQIPRALPQKWVCNNSCLVSADSVIDYASCLCCVKGLFYHCSDSDSGESCADDPCGCGPDRRTARWSCLATLSCILPCLWLYWPLRGCKRAVEACYARHSRAGCRCRPPLPTPEKRLLDSSSDF